VVSSVELKNLMMNINLYLLDVRALQKHSQLYLPNSYLIPFNELPSRVQEILKVKEVVVCCHSDMRSAAAAKQLNGSGLAQVSSLVDGLIVWIKQFGYGEGQ